VGNLYTLTKGAQAIRDFTRTVRTKLIGTKTIAIAGITLERISGDQVDPRLFVVFIHGLGDGPVSAWCRKGDERGKHYWPRWLVEDVGGLAAYSLGYPAAKASWNPGWPISEAAVAILDRVMADPGIRASGNAPIVFICHSFGGLIIKKLILVAEIDRKQEDRKGQFLDRIAGVVFLATPHGDSVLASVATRLPWFASDSTRDLAAHVLLDLNASYRTHVADNPFRIRHRVFYEKLGTWGGRVVSPTSADPGIPGARPIAIERNHATICKPQDRNDEVYTSVVAFLDEVLARRPPTQGELTREALKRVSETQKSVPIDSLRAILVSMGERAESYTPVEVEEKLLAKSSEFEELGERLNHLANADPEVEHLRIQASAALIAGSFAQADQFLAEAEARDLSGLDVIAARARQRRLSAAESRAERAAVALLHINADSYRRAAGHYGEASSIAAVADWTMGGEYLRSQTNTLARLGEEFGDNSALHEAMGILQASLSVIDRTRDPLDWAATQNSLGETLFKLGQHEGPDHFDKAVAAYSAALEEYTCERVPDRWAKTQNNLGNALTRLGEPQIGTARLEDAVAAYTAALAETSRERNPLDWAAIQNNLGIALTMLASREVETTRLGGAISAFHAALEVRTRARVPFDWARTQMNLGIALSALGSRGTETERFKEAVTAHHEALKEFTRDRAPLIWARTQNGLGGALCGLGKREEGTAHLEECVDAFHAALEVRTRARVPYQWAGTQNNLGYALRLLGKRQSGTALLEDSVSAYHAALEEWTRERYPIKWAMSFGHQGIAFMLIANRTKNGPLAETAVRQIQAALDAARTGGHEPLAKDFEAGLLEARVVRDRLKDA